MDKKDKERVHDEQTMEGVSGGTHKLITWVNGVYWRRCSECGMCVQVCKEEGIGAISLVNGAASVDKSKCNFCLMCMEECPENCIDIWRLFGEPRIAVGP